MQGLMAETFLDAHVHIISFSLIDSTAVTSQEDGSLKFAENIDTLAAMNEILAEIETSPLTYSPEM